MYDEYRDRDAIVSTEWLQQHLHDPGVRVFECTTYLLYRPPGSDAPYDVGSGRADYASQHIAGAAFLDLQNDLSDCDSPPHLRFRMLPLPDLARAFARQGIGDGLRVVLYTRGAMQWATRVWWMLRAVGFDTASVLDGGFEKWQREGRPLASGAQRYAEASLTPRPRPELFVDKAQVRAAMDDRSCRLINALAADLHRGDNARYGRPGHIPGSVNLPAAALIDPTHNTVLAPAAVRDAFDAAGVDPAGPTLVYCGGGSAATLDAFLMHQLGYAEVSVYDASMSEWARDESLPMETG
jgi:thiosulfate/3-mercaptopyruvate sulfurtransferase